MSPSTVSRIALYYRFVPLADPEAVRLQLQWWMVGEEEDDRGKHTDSE